MMEKYNVNQTTLKIFSLFSNDYKKSLYIREIAREISIDVKAVQMQLMRLEQENLLISEMKGKNKEYRLNLDNVLTFSNLTMGEIFASISYLKENFPIKKLLSEMGPFVDGVMILFGSFAKGEMTKYSDIDIFIISDNSVNIKVVREIERSLNRKVNIKSATKKEFISNLNEGDHLLKEVVENHIVLKASETFCEIMWDYARR